MKRCLLLITALSLSLPLQAQQFEGVLEWAQHVTLSSPLNGKITSVKATEGGKVKKGDLLVTLDPRLHQAKVKRAKAILNGLNTRFEDAQREYTRAKDLYERTVLSQTDLQSAEVRFNASLADQAQAEAELMQARVELEYTQIRAPFDGLVTELNVHPQEVVSNQFQTSTMLRLANTDQFKVTFWVPPKSTSELKPGDKAKISIEGQSANGTLLHVGLKAKREHQQMLTSVVVALPNVGGTLHAGRLAHITLP